MVGQAKAFLLLPLRKLWTGKSLETNFGGLFAEIFISIPAILMLLRRFISVLSGMVESQFGRELGSDRSQESLGYQRQVVKKPMR